MFCCVVHFTTVFFSMFGSVLKFAAVFSLLLRYIGRLRTFAAQNLKISKTMSKQFGLPLFAAKVRERNGKKQIFDVVRRRYVALTPEEWVRQHFVNYLITKREYPKEIIANEVAIRLHNTSKRCDTVVYGAYMEPLAVVEYKAPTVEITPKVFSQILRYNMTLHAKCLMVSNGIKHICCLMDYENEAYRFLAEIPTYDELLSTMNELKI